MINFMYFVYKYEFQSRLKKYFSILLSCFIHKLSFINSYYCKGPYSLNIIYEYDQTFIWGSFQPFYKYNDIYNVFWLN